MLKTLGLFLLLTFFWQATVCADEERKAYTAMDVIHPIVKALPAPDFYPQLGRVEMGVQTASEEAREHVLQGVSLINATWDFEAYRHFCEALKKDPDCLMAYWGATVSLGSGIPEFRGQWAAASSLMLDAMGAKDEAGEFIYPEYERDHAACAGILLTDGPAKASPLYEEMTRKYKNDLQSGLMSALLIKDGYDGFGSANEGQRRAEDLITALLKKHPDHPSVLSTYLLIHSEAPNKDERVRSLILPFARKLTRLSKNFGTHLQLRAFMEWRAGNHLISEQMAEQAELFYLVHMDKHGLTIADCEKWIVSRIQRCVSMAQRGEFSQAVELAKKLSVTPIDPGRSASLGGTIWLWDGRTLAARLYLANGAEGDVKKAMESLPTEDQEKPYTGLTLSSEFIKGMRIFGERLRLINAGVPDKADALAKQQQDLILKLSQRRDEALVSKAISEWYRSVRALTIWDFEAKGRAAMRRHGNDKKSAYNWYSSANDRQTLPNLSRVPLIAYPMELLVAEYFMSQENLDDAAARIEKALEMFPNHLPSLKLYETCLRKQGKTELADRAKAQIEYTQKPPVKE